MKWVIIITIIFSGSILGYMYYEMEKISAGNAQLSVVPNPNSVRIVDGYRDGIHRLSGTVKLPHSCYSVKTDTVIDKDDHSKVTIILTSKDNILDQPVCAQIRTRYPFETIVETQQAISVQLILDDVELPVIVNQTDWMDPSGNIINETPLD